MTSSEFSPQLFEATLQSAFSQAGVSLTSRQREQMTAYAAMLVDWNQKLNLTAIVDEGGIATRHMLDSVSIRDDIEKAGLYPNRPVRLIDVGTGAGFPGLVLKILNPEMDVLLLDALAKRLRFLDTIIDQLGLGNIETWHGRAEDAARSPDLREHFDVATARAVAALPVLCEYCLPFVRVGGIFVAMKGQASENWQDARQAIGLLGGKLESIREFDLPGTDMKRTILVVRKTNPTPRGYPRKAGQPSKNPL